MTLFNRLAAWLEPLRFFKHAAERRLQHERELREHTIEIIETVMSRVEKRGEQEAAVLLESAKASQLMAESLKVWFEMFKQNSEQQSSTVRGIDELDAARQRERQRLIDAGYPIDKSEADQLAWVLEHPLI